MKGRLNNKTQPPIKPHIVKLKKELKWYETPFYIYYILNGELVNFIL